MKHKLFLCWLFPFAFCLLTSSLLFAQSTATIGTGTTTNTFSNYPAPYGNYYWGAKHQILIRASELTAAGMTAGNITALAFQVSVPGGTPLQGFNIGLKTTTVTATASPFDMTGFVTVNGPQTYNDVTGWNTHTFTTPFAWNGTSNILVQTCFNNPGWSQNAEMFYTSTGYNSVTYYRQDLSNVCAQTGGIPSALRPNMKFTFTPNGPPTAQFTANPTSSCSGLVNFTDQSFYNITGWLWNFGDGSTSTSQNPSHTYTASGTYSVSLTATNANGNNTLTKPAYVTVNLGTGPIPAACTPTTTAWCCGFGITNFKFHNINNTSADASEGYKDFSCGLDTVTTGQSYTVSVSTLTPSGHNVRIWIDFNNDGTFSPTGELVFSADNSSLSTGTIFIPGNAVLSTPLRIRVSADHSLQPIPTPCSNPTYGQAEDYAIYVKPNTNPPVAKFSADDTVSCSGTIVFTDQSQNVPISWLWNFGDGTPTSSVPNPTHTYTASGTYSVSLFVSNGNGNNTLLKTNYIDVTLGNTPIAASCQPATFSYCCGYGIYKVQLSTINNSSPDAVEGYKDFSCDAQTTLTEGSSYPLSIQTSPTLTQDTKVWIDFNNNGVFTEANELVFTSLNSINPTGNIAIPLGAAVYNTLLRMRVMSENSGAIQGPCSPPIKGQVEDYAVKILQLVGVDEAEAEVKVEVYPNPFSESAVLAVSLPLAKGVGLAFADRGDWLLTLYDIYGRAIRSQTILNERTIIERGNLNAGVYFYTILKAGGNVLTGKLIIE